MTELSRLIFYKSLKYSFKKFGDPWTLTPPSIYGVFDCFRYLVSKEKKSLSVKWSCGNLYQQFLSIKTSLWTYMISSVGTFLLYLPVRSDAPWRTRLQGSIFTWIFHPHHIAHSILDRSLGPFRHIISKNIQYCS